MLRITRLLQLILVVSEITLISGCYGVLKTDNKKSVSLISSSQRPSVDQKNIHLSARSICPSGKKTFVTAHTKNHLMHICGDEQPTDFVGHSKKDKGGIVLPLTESTTDQFIAENGDVVYTLTPEFIIVTKNGRILRKDPIEKTK
jgi:hypothetical protein